MLFNKKVIMFNVLNYVSIRQDINDLWSSFVIVLKKYILPENNEFLSPILRGMSSRSKKYENTWVFIFKANS